MKPRLDTESKIKVEEILEKSSQGEVDIMVSNLGKSLDNMIREGKEEGRKTGMEEGREEVRKSISIKLLTKKFGTLPEDMTEKIERLPMETLETIIDNIFDLKSLDEVSEYLK